MKRWIIFTLLLTMSLTALATAQTPDQDTLVRDNIAFAFDMYHQLDAEGGNIIFSPYSISQALAMTYAGAEGNTASQMAGTLHFSLPQESLHPTFQALNSEITSFEPVSEGDPFQLSIANALWGQAGFGFNPAYLETVNAHYGGGLREVDFKTDPSGAREIINAWVAEQTQDKIQNLIPELSPMVRLILTNAIYFKASWQDPFEEPFTREEPFTLLDGSTVMAPLMNNTEGYLYYAGENYQALSLPYKGSDKAMLVILPAAGQFEAVQAALSAEMYTDIWLGLDYQEVWVTLPRFSYEFEASLVQTLLALGMTDAFDSQLADFSAMITPDNPEELFISDVIHKAFIAVDESGTEAAAATAVIMETAGAAAAEPIAFRADRPFIYLLYDQSTGSILFMGQLLNP